MTTESSAHPARTGPTPALSRSASFVRVTLAYVVAIAAGLAVLLAVDTGRGWLDVLLADLAATVVIFGFSRFYRNSSFYDAFWSVIPPLVALAWWVDRPDGVDGSDAVRFWLLFAVIMVWAVRLTANWAYGFPGLHHEDWRYALLRERAGGGPASFLVDLFAIHVIPTIQVFLGLLPVYVVTRHDRNLSWLDVLAVVVGLGAILLESLADLQMHRFVAGKAAGTIESGAAMDRGLWSWSRHPNYFGEFGFWVSMALFGLAAAPDTWWWVFVGAAAMLAMFQGASIPMMEERSLARRPSYQQVIDTVPRFVPRPARRA